MRRGVALAAMATVLTSCRGDSADRAGIRAPLQPSSLPNAPGGPAPFAGPGPYPAGVTTLSLPDRKVEVWYPAAKGSGQGKPKATYDQRDPLPPGVARLLGERPGLKVEQSAYRDLPVADGRFPVLVFNHGAAGWRNDYSHMASGMASWGFVFASVDTLERGRAALAGGDKGTPGHDDATDLTGTADLLRTEDARAGGTFAGHVDTGRMAAGGHSAGGAATLKVLGDDRFRAFVLVAPAGGAPPSPPAKPTLVVAARGDIAIPPDRVLALYDALAAPKRLVVVEQAGHNSFTDACDSIRAGASLVDVARQLGLPIPESLLRLGENGCTDADLPAEQVRAVWQDVTVAHLRAAFGIDRQPVGLDDALTTAFPGVALEYRHVG